MPSMEHLYCWSLAIDGWRWLENKAIRALAHSDAYTNSLYLDGANRI